MTHSKELLPHRHHHPSKGLTHDFLSLCLCINTVTRLLDRDVDAATARNFATQTDADGGTDLDLAARASHDVIPAHARVRKYSLAGLAALVVHAETLEDVVVGDPCTASRPEDGRLEAVRVGPSEEVGVNTANDGVDAVDAVEIVIVDRHAEVADHSSEGAGGLEA